MFRSASRAIRTRQILTVVAVTVLGACADDQSITAPQQNAADPRVAGGAGALETTDATVVTISPDREGNVRVYSGYAGVTGTVTCSNAGTLVTLQASARQELMRGKTTVTGSGYVTVTCTTSPQFFQAIVVPYPGNGPFQRGKAHVQVDAYVADAHVAQVVRTVRLQEVASY